MSRVNVILNNRYAHFPDGAKVNVLRSYFRHRVKGYQFSNWYISGNWDGYYKWWKRDRVPIGLYLHLKQRIEKRTSIRFVEHQEWELLQFRPLGSLVLPMERRRYQEQALKALIGASPCGGLILQCTGAGKTKLIASYFAYLKGSACFIVDELTLLEQARSAIHSVTGEPVGIIGKSQFDPQRLTCATAQSLQKHARKREFKAWFKKLDVVVIDEFHVMLNRRSMDIVRQVRPKTVIGLTATLQLRRKAVRYSAMALAGPVLYTYPLRRGVQEGYLSIGVATMVQFVDKLRPAVPTQAQYGVYIARNRRRNDLIEGIVREGYKRGHSIGVLVERVHHLHWLSQRLTDLDHRVAYGAVSSQDRRQIQKDMEAGKLRLVIANRVFGKGIDISKLDMIVDACASSNPNSPVQRYGRGTRRAEGKIGLLYFDISDGGYSNPFQRAAEARRRALKAEGIEVAEVSGEVAAEQILNKAEHALEVLKNRFAARRIGLKGPR